MNIFDVSRLLQLEETGLDGSSPHRHFMCRAGLLSVVETLLSFYKGDHGVPYFRATSLSRLESLRDICIQSDADVVEVPLWAENRLSDWVDPLED